MFLRRMVVWLSVVVLVLGLAAVVWWKASIYKMECARTEWKTATLPKLAELSPENEEIRRELVTLKANQRAGKDLEWTGQQVLLMANDEYLIYAFHHGLNNGWVDHLFLAHGSDGRWYYCTYHFCNSMAGVWCDNAPSSIAEFAERYGAREFDGKSDECLKHTTAPERKGH